VTDTASVPSPIRPGLLAKLMAAVRPEFRVEEFAFDPVDPVFGGGLRGVQLRPDGPRPGSVRRAL